MKKFIIYLFIIVLVSSISYRWDFLVKFPKDTWKKISKNKDRQPMFDLFKNTIKENVPKCKRAYIDYENNTDDKYVNIYYMCFEWEL